MNVERWNLYENNQKNVTTTSVTSFTWADYKTDVKYCCVLKQPKGTAAMLMVDKVKESRWFLSLHCHKTGGVCLFPIPVSLLYFSFPCPPTFTSDRERVFPFQDLAVSLFICTLWQLFLLPGFPPTRPCPKNTSFLPCPPVSKGSDWGFTPQRCSVQTLQPGSLLSTQEEIFHNNLCCYYNYCHYYFVRVSPLIISTLQLLTASQTAQRWGNLTYVPSG